MDDVVDDDELLLLDEELDELEELEELDEELLLLEEELLELVLVLVGVELVLVLVLVELGLVVELVLDSVGAVVDVSELSVEVLDVSSLDAVATASLEGLALSDVAEAVAGAVPSAANAAPTGNERALAASAEHNTTPVRSFMKDLPSASRWSQRQPHDAIAAVLVAGETSAPVQHRPQRRNRCSRLSHSSVSAAGMSSTR